MTTPGPHAEPPGAGGAAVAGLRRAGRAVAAAVRRAGLAVAAGLGRVLAWWRALRPGTRSTWIGVGVVALTGVLAGLIAVPTAAVQGSLGPHRALYEVTTAHEVRVDLGPLGSLAVDSPAPWPLGVTVFVREIPAGLTAVGDNPALALIDDLDGYLQFFAQPDLAVRDAGQALVTDALGRAVLLWSVFLVLAAAGRLAAHEGALRVQIRTSLARPGVGVLVGAVLVVAMIVPTAVVAARDQPAGRRSPVLAGTALAEARIVGRLGDLLDTYGTLALEAIEENRVFYEAAAANLALAYAEDPEPLEPGPGSLDPRPPVEGAPDGGGTPDAGEPDGAVTDGSGLPEGTEAPAPEDGDVVVGAPGEDATTQEGAAPSSAEPTPTPTPEPTGRPEDIVTLLMVTDLHCNVGMAGVVGEAARLAGAQAVLNAGDTVISGTSVEEFCVQALAGAVPSDVPIVVADGNHDSEETTAQERRAGNVVLEGEPLVVAGVRILGDIEPTLTTVTEGTRLKGEETRAQMARRLAARACEAQDAGEQVDILMVHNPRAGVAPMSTGCIPLQLSGHMHRQIGPTPQGLGLLYVAGSTGGATLGGQTIGPLQAAGVMTVLRFDPVGHRPVAHRIITIGTDSSASLGPWLPFPQPSDEVVEVDFTGEVASY